MKKTLKLLTAPAMLAVSMSSYATVMTEWVSYNQVGDDLNEINGHQFLQYRDAGFTHQNTFGADTYDWQISCSAPCTTNASDWTLQTAGLLASEYRRSNQQGSVSYQYGGDTSGWELWLYSGQGLTATTTFDVSSTGVAFMMIGDYNDGPANYYVDGVLVETENLRYGVFGDGPDWRSLVVTGLSNGAHTVSVEFASDTTDFLDEQHVAMFGAAAIDVPEPSTVALFSTALFGGLAAARRKKVKQH